MKPYLRVITVIICCLLTPVLSAQEENSNYYPVDFSLQLKNMHLWRGIEVTPSMTFAPDIHFIDRSERFNLGIWAGASTNGSFKELDYYISYMIGNVKLAVWDVYNFSPEATYNNNELFNYKAKKTGHFIDVSAKWKIDKSIPLTLYWATLVYGRDRDILNRQNRYSTYIEAEYRVIRHSFVNVDMGLGGAFALRKGRDEYGNISNAHFYGEKATIVDVHITFSKVLELWKYKLPVAVMVMWNPENNYGNLQLTFDLF